MIKYRVYVKVSYNTAYFDFDDIQEAGDFAKTILTHHTPNDDSRDFDGVKIEVIDISKESEDEE